MVLFGRPPVVIHRARCLASTPSCNRGGITAYGNQPSTPRPEQVIFRGIADNDWTNLHCCLCRLVKQLCALRNNAHRAYTEGAVFALLSFLRRSVREADGVLAACDGLSGLFSLEGARREGVSGGVTVSLVDAQQVCSHSIITPALFRMRASSARARAHIPSRPCRCLCPCLIGPPTLLSLPRH